MKCNNFAGDGLYKAAAKNSGFLFTVSLFSL
jgi:hypothetical protein